MTGLTEIEFKKWKIKRKRTVFGYLVISLLCGVDYSFLFATLYLYLTTVIKTDHANFYYGIIIAAFCISSILTGVIAGYFIDKNRKMKMFTLFTLSLQIIGNLLYSVPFSPINLLIGRFIAGASDCFTSVACGEIVRLYDVKEGTTAMWRIASAFSIGFVVGPCIGAIFKGSIDFHVGPFQFNYINFTSVVISGMGALALMSSIFMLHDCSLEFNFREHLSKHDKHEHEYENIDSMNESSEKGKFGKILHRKAVQEASIFWLKIKQIFIKEGNVLLIMISSFAFVYCLLGIDMILPLLTMNVLEWGYYGYVIVSAVYGFLYCFVLVVCSKYCVTGSRIYLMTIFCILCSMVCLFTIILMVYFERKLIQDAIIMAIFLLSYTFIWFLEEILARLLIARMVPTNVQSLSQSLRTGFARIGTVTAALTVAISFPILHYWCMGMLFVMLVVLCIFLARHKSLIEIKEFKVTLLGCKHSSVN